MDRLKYTSSSCTRRVINEIKHNYLLKEKVEEIEQLAEEFLSTLIVKDDVTKTYAKEMFVCGYIASYIYPEKINEHL